MAEKKNLLMSSLSAAIAMRKKRNAPSSTCWTYRNIEINPISLSQM
jgi:hypothetical protein